MGLNPAANVFWPRITEDADSGIEASAVLVVDLDRDMVIVDTADIADDTWPAGAGPL